ncbi:hypothetical protein [Dasania marina]|uniref:hypothetical protein n=1 Tax=Dasania marina TaxID=471499 RepID=UPI0030DD90CA|tara:strand:- start:14189 stop:16396 length:2208 start_codon:yes stop_codon:yes gene_type:complete
MTQPSNPTDKPANNAEPHPLASNKLIIETAEITAENTTALTAATDKYSDYEIAVESQEFYPDALFSSDDELDLALTKTKAKSSLAKPKPEQTVKPDLDVAVQLVNQPEPIDLTAFISSHSQQKKFQAGKHLFSKEGQQLPCLQNGALNTLVLLEQQLTPHYHFVSTLPVAQRPSLITGQKNAKQRWLNGKMLAHYQWQKIRIALDQYLGRSLPARTLDLDYKALKLKPKSQLGNILSLYEINKRFNSKAINVEQLISLASDELNNIAICALSARKKQQLVAGYSQLLRPQLQAYIHSSNLQPLANKQKQQELQVEAIKSICKSIISIYKQLYMPLYQASNLIYGPQRRKAQSLAYTLIDWLCMEQWLYSAMLAPLPNSSIKTLNSLFYALACYEPQQLEQTQISLCSDSTVSLKALYIRYQLLLIIDFSTINSRLHQHVIAQLLAAIPLVSLFKLPNQQPQACHAIPCHHSTVMQFVSAAKLSQVVGIGLDLAEATSAIKSDYQQQLATLGSAKTGSGKNIFAASAALMTQLVVFSQQQSPQHYSLYQEEKLTLFSGFNDCFNHSWYRYVHNVKSQNKVTDIELPPLPKSSSGPWGVALDNETTLCLQTPEAKINTRLNIGQPLIISQHHEQQGKTELQLALLTRITRSQTKLVDLELRKVASDFTGAIINEALPPHNKALLYSADNKYYLLTPSAEPCWKGKTLSLRLHNEETVVVCIKALVQDFGQHRVYLLF